MKKPYIFIIVLLSVGIIAYLINNKNNVADFPNQQIFNLNVTCKENAISGESVNIIASFTSNSDTEYEVVSSNTSFFEVLVNNERLTTDNEGTMSTILSGGETRKNTYTFIPDKIGIYEIKVIVAFEVRISPTDTKKYSYEKTASINILEGLE